MSARIVQTNETPFEQVKIDPVTLDIIENALRNARIEMDTTLVRTAMSPGIREQGDAFPLIADHKGRMIVGQFGSYIGPFLDGYDGTVEEGDMIFLSDPYSVQGAISHSNDWLVLLPVFKDGRLIAYTSMFGHQSDIGGKVAGSMPIDATSIFQEGVRIPPVKIWKKGEYNEDLIKLVLAQSRSPEWCKADLNALIAACRVAARRVIEMAERFGDDVLVSACEDLLARNHRAMKALIDTAIGEEPVSFEDYICDDGLGYGPYKIKCTMWREDGPNGMRVVLDFAGTDPQSNGSINFLLNENMMRMFFGIYMIMVFDPQILFNDGYYDLIDVRIPEGSLLKPKFPAALSGRTHALGRLFDILGGAARPEDARVPQCRRVQLVAAPVSTRAATARASGSSCSRSGSAASPAGRSATAPTVTRCGPTSPTCPTSSSSATSRCGSSVTRPFPTVAAPASIAAATVF